MTPNVCGCRQCGGPGARDDALMARRVIARADYIAATRGPNLAQRVIRPDLYTRLVMTTARGWGRP